MFLVKISSHFYSAHRLADYNGKCANLHGHNYKVDAFFRSDDLTKTGFVIDFGKLKKVLNKITDKYDHKAILKQCNMNTDLISLLTSEGEEVILLEKNPTAENLAKIIYNELWANFPGLVSKVRIYESEDCYAEYCERL